MEHLERHTLLVGEQTAASPWKTTWQNDLELDNATPASTAARPPPTRSPTDPQENLHNSTTHNSPKAETTRMPVYRSVLK